jgi:hypothetical protein
VPERHRLTSRYAIRTKSFEPSTANWTESEHVDVLHCRWWMLDELAATTEAYEPAELIALVREQQLRAS